MSLPDQHPDVAACRALWATIADDVDDLSDGEVIARAESFVDSYETTGRVAEEHDAPLQPDHLPALDLSTVADVAAFVAELRYALGRRS
jgi:hypothetical protein